SVFFESLPPTLLIPSLRSTPPPLYLPDQGGWTGGQACCQTPPQLITGFAVVPRRPNTPPASPSEHANRNIINIPLTRRSASLTPPPRAAPFWVGSAGS